MRVHYGLVRPGYGLVAKYKNAVAKPNYTMFLMECSDQLLKYEGLAGLTCASVKTVLYRITLYEIKL